MIIRQLTLAAIAWLLLTVPLPAAAGTTPVPQTYGTVIIRKYSRAAHIAPVRFDHWLHRSLYTCRLCHVDIGFTMEENGTGITAESNRKGFYCGACHNGTMRYRERTVFASCSANAAGSAENRQCARCHSVGKTGAREYSYDAFTEPFPRYSLDDLINWEEAEARGIIRPVDELRGISIPRKPLQPPQDFLIVSKSTWMSDIVFSHKKHAIWNGCEVCHPEIFPSTRKGTVSYSMLDISGGQYCGLCHGRVAFHLNNCEKCHARGAP